MGLICISIKNTEFVPDIYLLEVETRRGGCQTMENFVWNQFLISFPNSF